MLVDGIVYGDAAMAGDLRNDPCLEQVRNVAHLPGIVGASLAMPDVHWGYGFPMVGWRPPAPTAGSSRQAGSATTSIEASACCAQV